MILTLVLNFFLWLDPPVLPKKSNIVTKRSSSCSPERQIIIENLFPPSTPCNNQSIHQQRSSTDGVMRTFQPHVPPPESLCVIEERQEKENPPSTFERSPRARIYCAMDIIFRIALCVPSPCVDVCHGAAAGATGKTCIPKNIYTSRLTTPTEPTWSASGQFGQLAVRGK